MIESAEDALSGDQSPNGKSRIGDDPEDLRLAVANVLDYAIILLDPDGYVATWNPGAERFKGYTANEIIGKHFSSFYPAEAIAIGFPQKELEIASQLGRFEDEGWRVRKDGSLFWANVVITAVRDKDGQLRGFAKVTRDLTERKQSEEAVRASEERLRRMVESDLIGIVFFNIDGTFTYVNDAFLKMMGYARDDLDAGRLNWKAITPPEDKEIDAQIFADLTAQGFCRTVEKDFIRFNGQKLPILLGASSFEAPPVTAVAFVLDNTDRKRYEKQLALARAELENRFAARTAELEQANEDLRLSKEEADAANAAKSEFLSRMSHELRTPLNAILGFGQLLAMTNLGAEDRSSVDHIVHAGEHLLKLVNEVLDIARVEAGRMELSIEAVMVGVVLSDTLALVSALATRNGIIVSVDASDREGLHVLADHQRLVQVLINLLSNAVKYNRPAGHVWVSTKETDTMVEIAVSDTGKGIEKQDLPRLFKPFERLDAVRTTIEGTGLGLALSKRMIEAMGGRLEVESEVGTGSTFKVILPIAAPPVEVVLPDHSLTPGSDEPLANQRPFSLLYIEDNISNFGLIEAVLKHRPTVKLLGAMQGSVGLDLAKNHRPDLILLDLNLPDMHGHEVLRTLGTSEDTASIPVVILSADATARQIERLLAAGARHYLTKPLKISDFLAVLDEFITREPRPDEAA